MGVGDSGEVEDSGVQTTISSLIVDEYKNFRSPYTYMYYTPMQEENHALTVYAQVMR